jgi:hypothetical protein
VCYNQQRDSGHSLRYEGHLFFVERFMAIIGQKFEVGDIVSVLSLKGQQATITGVMEGELCFEYMISYKNVTAKALEDDMVLIERPLKDDYKSELN